MDVNQTRFHLVYGPADWNPAGSASSPAAEPLFDWNASDATLSLHQNLFIFPRNPGELPLGENNRRGAGQDRYGNWYSIAESQQELRFRGAKQKATEHFWAASDLQRACALQGQFFDANPAGVSQLTFSGLAVTPQHYLVVGLLQPAGLLVFDLYAGGPPERQLWPSDVAFAPFDMSVAPDGGIFVLDRVNKRYWKLDRELRVQSLQAVPAKPAAPEIFQPVGAALSSAQPSCDSSPITAEFAVSLAAFSDVVAIAALPDGSVLLLENPPGGLFSIVHRFQEGTEVGPAVPLDNALAQYVPAAPSPQDPDPQAIRAYDFALVPSAGSTGGVLYLAESAGDQCFACNLTISGNTFSVNVSPQYFPMRQFGGKDLVATPSGVYYDYQDVWYPLAEQPQPQYQLQAQLILPQKTPAGQSASGSTGFDGKLPGCVWHRLFLDACIPHGASVQIESRAADSLQLLPDAPWQLEPTPYVRDNGPEIPYVKSQLQGPADRVGTLELLFQRAQGRYLQLRLTLRGTGRNSPRLHALRIYYPRFSYLRHYLPATYRDDAVSASFLDRYLANLEGFYTVLEGKIAGVQELFDSRLVPAEYLDWLASWFSLELEPTWSERTRRLVISHALQMFRERGTPNGIVRAIRLMTDASPDESLFDNPACTSGTCASSLPSSTFSVRLVEKFLTRGAPGILLGDVTTVTGPGSVGTASGSKWSPAQGSEPLSALYRCYLQTQYSTIGTLNDAWVTNYIGFDDMTLVLPAIQPAQSAQAQDWQRFLRDGIGFTYAAVSISDAAAYQAFLARRYKTISALNTAYSLTGSSAWGNFASITLPAMLPSGGPQLQDWILFVSVALPVQQNAHQFTVLVPVSLTDSAEAQQSKLAVAERVTEIEKPAHTSFDVQLYWAFFRAGGAQLGVDTLLGPSSRFVGLVLGQGYLAGGNLAPVEPISAKDRKRLGGRSLYTRCRELRPQEKCP